MNLQRVHAQWLNRVRLFETPWIVACQAPLSMGFSRQEYWNGLPCTPPGDLPDPGIEPTSLVSPALAGGFLPLHQGSAFVRQGSHLDRRAEPRVLHPC